MGSLAVFTIYTLEESNVSVSGGAQLDGVTQGDGSHLIGVTITLNNNAWETVQVDDSDDTSFGDSDNSQTLQNSIVYDGVNHAAGARTEAEYSLTVQDPSGNTYTLVAFNINQPTGTSYATVEGLAFVGGVGGFPPIGVPLTVSAAQEGPNFSYSSLATPPCFTTGCLMETPSGLTPIEALRVGDSVVTLNDGVQGIRWIGRKHVGLIEQEVNPKLRPVRILAGALAPGIPERDLLVSRQHRVLVSSKISTRLFDHDEVLVPAVKLLALPGVHLEQPQFELEYFHLLLDKHCIVWSNGAPTESLYVGPEVLGSVDRDSLEEIFGLFPELRLDGVRPTPARHLPERGKAMDQLIARHLKHGRPLLPAGFGE